MNNNQSISSSSSSSLGPATRIPTDLNFVAGISLKKRKFTNFVEENFNPNCSYIIDGEQLGKMAKNGEEFLELNSKTYLYL